MAISIATTPHKKAPRILRLREVLHRVGMGKSTLYSRIQEGRFPAPAMIGGRNAGWLESEINEWILDQFKNAEAANDAEVTE